MVDLKIAQKLLVLVVVLEHIRG